MIYGNLKQKLGKFHHCFKKQKKIKMMRILLNLKLWSLLWVRIFKYQKVIGSFFRIVLCMNSQHLF